MGTFLLILLIFFVLYALFGKKTKNKPVPVSMERSNKQRPTSYFNKELQEGTSKQASVADDQKRKELIQSLVSSIKVTVSAGTDDSIIDVTDQTYRLPSPASTASKVPYWPHQYVYSYEEINSATLGQKAFYQQFKTNFLKGVYLDVEGNSNYYFILLFDLLKQADKETSLDGLETNLKALAENYPKTASYCRNFLFQKMQQRGDQAGINRLVNEGAFQSISNDLGYYRLGTKFKDKLKLKGEEVSLANKIYDPANNFSGIEFCLLQMVKLYLRVVEQLNEEYKKENTSLEAQITSIAEMVAKRVFHYKPGTYNYKYAVESTSNELYMLLFKHCENALREHYGHKRKLNTDNNYKAEIKQELEAKILSKLPTIFPVALPVVDLPDTATELALNEQNTTRWKYSFEKLTSNFTAKESPQFVEKIIKLGKLNKKNPSVENIFFEASKFIAKWDKEAALKLYVHYLYHDMHSEFFDQKPFTKTIQKSLFKSQEELQTFERIISDLIKSKNLEQAVNAIPAVYAPKRKKINLDSAAILEVSKQHSTTIDLLDEILGEDESNVVTPISAIPSDEVALQVAPKQQPSNVLATSVAGLTVVQTELLELFFKGSFVVAQQDVESFARIRGLFSNGLIESVNESCYEKLDDLLIDEEDENYIMNPDYYQTITAK